MARAAMNGWRAAASTRSYAEVGPLLPATATPVPGGDRDRGLSSTGRPHPGDAPVHRHGTADRSSWSIALSEAALVTGIFLVPRALVLVAALMFVVHRRQWNQRVALLLTCVQVAVTLNYRIARAFPIFQGFGLSFTIVDVLTVAVVTAALVGSERGRRPWCGGVSERLRARYARHITLLTAGVAAYSVIPFLITWAYSSGDLAVAVRNLRSLWYVLAAVTFLSAVRRVPGLAAHILVAVNGASVGASVCQVAQALQLTQIAGFEDVELSLRADSLIRLGIIEEGFYPVLAAFAVASAALNVGSKAVRRSGIVALLALAAALIGSPGRGAIFASGISILVTVIVGAVYGRGSRSTAGSRSMVVAVGAVACVLASAAVITDSDDEREVFRSRAQQGLVAPSNAELSTRLRSWGAGIQFGLGAPIFGRGLGTRIEQIKLTHSLDSDYNFAGTPPDLFAKTGVIGLAGVTILLSAPARFVLRRQRRSHTGLALVVLPVSAALAVRAFSDQLVLAFQFPILFSILAALAMEVSLNSDACDD